MTLPPGGDDLVDRRAAEGVEGIDRRRRRRRRDGGRRVVRDEIGRRRGERPLGGRLTEERGIVPAVGQLLPGGRVAQPLQLLLELPGKSSSETSLVRVSYLRLQCFPDKRSTDIGLFFGRPE